MRITKIHFGHGVGNTTPRTELPRYFCAGIGPLQLGIVLVFIYVILDSIIFCHSSYYMMTQVTVSENKMSM